MKNNFTYKLLALFLAVLLWLYVTNQQNPVIENTFSVPLEIKNLSSKLVVADKTSLVTIRLSARKQVLDKITSKDIRAFVDMENGILGSNTEAVEVTGPKDTQVVGVSPLQGQVTLTRVSSKQIPLKIKINAPLPQGYDMLDQQLTPSDVVVSGPLNILDKVANAVVEVDLSGQKNNLVKHLPIRIYDDKDNDLSDWLKIQPDLADLYLAIAPTQPRKLVAVKPIFSGTLAAGKTIVKVVSDPQIVTISGTDLLLKDQFTAPTLPIDLTNKSGNFSVETSLSLPKGVLVTPQNKIHVTVVIQ